MGRPMARKVLHSFYLGYPKKKKKFYTYLSHAAKTGIARLHSYYAVGLLTVVFLVPTVVHTVHILSSSNYCEE